MASILTYLAARRQSGIQEREIYLRTIDQFVGNLCQEIERLKAELAEREARIDQLERKVSHVEQEAHRLRQG